MVIGTKYRCYLAEEDVLLKMVLLRAELLRTCLLHSSYSKAGLLQEHQALTELHR